MTSTDPAGGDRPQIVLRTTASPEAVAPIRHFLAGFGEELGLHPEGVANLKTIVSEACTNVVVHAYADGAGEMEVAALADESMVEIRVRDFGSGIAPIAETDAETLRLGLSLIAALADAFEIHASRGEGTEIRARLSRAPSNGHGPPPERGQELAQAPGEEIRVAIGPQEASTSALAHLVSATGAQADLPVDRLEEAAVVAESLARAAFERIADQSRLGVAVDVIDAGLRLRFGPIEPGGADRLLGDLELPEIGSVAKLADSVEVEPVEDGGAETIVLSFGARSR